MHRKWAEMERAQKKIQQKMRNAKGVSEYFTDLPEAGYMRDNISKKMVRIADCKSSTLRRYEKLLRKYYSLCQKPEERKTISDKLQEVKAEMNARPDGE